jgi:hypothetical protein
VLAEAAGITAGSWFAWPATRPGFELVAAGMMIMAGGHDGKPMNFARARALHAARLRSGDEIAEGRTAKSAWTLCRDPWRGGRGSNPDLMLGTCSTIELQPQ